MKRNIIIFFGLIIGTILLKSCFVDEGNYNYIDIETNKIEIAFSPSSVALLPGEPVKFTPIVTYHNKAQLDTNIYKWEYRFNSFGGLVHTGRDLEMFFNDVVVGLQYYGTVTAKDTTTGATYFSTIRFEYINPYAKGWLVLSDDNNESILSFARIKNDEWIADNNFYKLLRNKRLGSNPVSIILHTYAYSNREVRIIQDKSAILDVETFVNLREFESEFLGNKYPEGFKPKNIVTTLGNLTAVLGENGKLYTKTFKNRDDYLFQTFVDVPLQFNNQTLDVQYLLSGPLGSYDFVIYDKVTSSFYKLEGMFYSESGRVHQLKAPSYWNPSQGSPSPSDLSKYDIIDCQANVSAFQLNFTCILKEKSTGKFYSYAIDYMTMFGNSVQGITYKEIPPSAAALLDNNAKVHILRGRPYIFFSPASDPNKLYFYDTRTSTHAVYKEDFGSKITAIESQHNTNNSLGVGLENGKFYILDISENMLIGGTEEEKVTFETQYDGKIVDVFYKEY